MRLALVAVAAFATLSPAPARSQQVLETDPAAGRTVIDGPFRAISRQPFLVGIGHRERVVHLFDDEEPEGVMAFSLVTGELLRTLRIRRGDGPGELRWITGLTPAADGGAYVSGRAAGGERVLEFDSQARHESMWSVRDVTARNLCEIDGQPAVVSSADGRLVRRGSDGSEAAIGDWSVDLPSDSAAPDWSMRVTGAYYRTSLTCMDGSAYVLRIPESGPPGPFAVLRRGEPTGALELPAVPPEFPDAQDWQLYGVSSDGRGNIVLTSQDDSFWGAVIDPETGCHAILRTPGRLREEIVGVYADSAVVLHREYEVTRDGAATMVQLFNVAGRVSLVPFRRVSGAPCADMFPSLGDAGGANGPGAGGSVE